MLGDGHPAELRRDPPVVVEVDVRADRGLQITGPAPSDAVAHLRLHPPEEALAGGVVAAVALPRHRAGDAEAARTKGK